MNSQKRTPYLLIWALIVAGCIAISPGAKAADNAAGSSEKIHELLTQVKAEAIELKQDAHDLEMWAQGKQISWQSHAAQLNVIREHVNEAGKLLTQMNEARHTASPWQQQAIDRIHPLLKELADNTGATIIYFNDNKSQIHLSDYADYAKAGSDLAEELASLVSDYVDFGEHEADYHRLKDKLEPAAS
jgi:hypothetical protein